MIIFFNRRKQESCDKKKLDSLHPSISRSQEETKKLKPSGNEFGDCIFIDEEEEKNEEVTLDQPMPMSLEEPYIEFDPMEEEVEMEDMEEEQEEPVLDIDEYDANNSLAAVEYVQDLYDFYRKTEVRFLNMSLNQNHKILNSD
jgi:cyclin B